MPQDCWERYKHHNGGGATNIMSEKLDVQSFTKYFRLTCKIAHYEKSLISIFQEFFAGINKNFYFSRKTGH